jgi:hypothetical protein
MTVFDAFPNAIEQGWQIAQVAYSSITGNTVTTGTDIDVIIDEGSSSDANQAPNAAGLFADTLVYTKPDQMPTTDTSALVAGYVLIDPNERTWEIIDAGQGKNQDNGQIEHIELKIRQIGANDGQ